MKNGETFWLNSFLLLGRIKKKKRAKFANVCFTKFICSALAQKADKEMNFWVFVVVNGWSAKDEDGFPETLFDLQSWARRLAPEEEESFLNKDFYEILGVPKSATTRDIVKAYRKLTLKYHPDLNRGASQVIKDEAKSRMQTLVDIKETLVNAERRRKYNRQIFSPRRKTDSCMSFVWSSCMPE